MMVGVEALLRWTHSDRGSVPPIVMVPIAERSALIVDIGAWVLERACNDHALWAEHHPDLKLDLAVNVSVRQLMTSGYCSSVAEILARTEMDPASLILELTESIVIEHSARIMAVLVALNRLGVRLALDDFGTGYSSLSYLSKLPIQIVKIDQGLVAELNQATGRIVVAGVADIAHALGISVVAEGVETEMQREETFAVGCDFAQGYLFARPMPADSVDALLVAC
jgi:EAL domain-containing protein (putative c-di-GMP-specific phosphodiesterase class I)